jgi:hypothetical protein
MELVELKQEQDWMKEGNILDSKGKYDEVIATMIKHSGLIQLMQMHGSIKERP